MVASETPMRAAIPRHESRPFFCRASMMLRSTASSRGAGETAPRRGLEFARLDAPVLRNARCVYHFASHEVNFVPKETPHARRDGAGAGGCEIHALLDR